VSISLLFKKVLSLNVIAIFNLGTFKIVHFITCEILLSILANGDVIVSILPVNTKWPWVTPASFRPELVPEELMVPGLTLTVEEFVHAMELLTSDLRFNAYTICYKRLLASWLTAAFLILLIILFSGVAGIGLFALGISWLILNAGAVFLCMYIKIKVILDEGFSRILNHLSYFY
jgi:hypothetical protein